MGHDMIVVARVVVVVMAATNMLFGGAMFFDSRSPLRGTGFSLMAFAAILAGIGLAI